MCNLSFSHFTETESCRVRNVWMLQDRVRKKARQVILYSCTGNDNQRWLTDDNKIKGKQSRKCLGTNSIIVRKGDPVVLADCDFSRALEFTIR